MKGFLFDTNVISEVRKPKPHGGVLAWVASLKPDEIYIPAIALFEMQAGVELTRRQDADKAGEIERWIDSLCSLDNILPMDERSCRLSAKLMHGRSEDILIDSMVASIALTFGLIVATRNTNDYRCFQVEVFNPFAPRR